GRAERMILAIQRAGHLLEGDRIGGRQDAEDFLPHKIGLVGGKTSLDGEARSKIIGYSEVDPFNEGNAQMATPNEGKHCRRHAKPVSHSDQEQLFLLLKQMRLDSGEERPAQKNIRAGGYKT